LTDVISAFGQRRDRVIMAERLRQALAAQRKAAAAEHLFRFGTGHDHAAFAVEQQDAFRKTAYDLLQLIADRFAFRPLTRETAAQFAQSLRDRLHLDIHWTRLGNLRAFDLKLLDAFHYFTQRP